MKKLTMANVHQNGRLEKAWKTLQTLPGFRPEGDGFLACCPAHNDRKPSLRITEENDGRILLVCRSQRCSFEHIVAALGLEQRDFFSASKTGTPRRPSAPPSGRQAVPKSIDPAIVERCHTALTDSDRAFLRTQRLFTDEVINRFKVGRHRDVFTLPIADAEGQYRDLRKWQPKGIKPGQGTSKYRAWAKGYGGGSRLWPIDVLTGLIPGGRVVLAEGEADVLALLSSNLSAVTNTNGVGTWCHISASELERFRDLEVIIATDNDPAGRKGAEGRYRSLKGIAQSVRVVVWPDDRADKWDATDELEAPWQRLVKGPHRSGPTFRGGAR